MIQQIERLFRRWGLIAPFDRDDVINAEIDNASHSADKAIERLQGSLAKRFEANTKLRTALRIAKVRTNSFEQFERLIAGGGHAEDQ